MTLPVEPVFSKLRSDFVLSWSNIIKKDYVGESHGYTCEQTSVGTTNGAGPHNVQIFMCSPDGVVLNALPGYWHPDDLARELELAQRLLVVWNDASLSVQDKRARFTQMQNQQLATASRKTIARSGWQGFDAKNEIKRLTKGIVRDTFEAGPDGELIKDRRGKPKIKNTYRLAKERMAARPFVELAEFDVFEFADYGRIYYDNNKKVDGRGETFMTPRKIAKEQQREEKRRLQREKLAKRKAEAEARRRSHAAHRAAQRASAKKRAAERKRRIN